MIVSGPSSASALSRKPSPESLVWAVLCRLFSWFSGSRTSLPSCTGATSLTCSSPRLAAALPCCVLQHRPYSAVESSPPCRGLPHHQPGSFPKALSRTALGTVLGTERAPGRDAEWKRRIFLQRMGSWGRHRRRGETSAGDPGLEGTLRLTW